MPAFAGMTPSEQLFDRARLSRTKFFRIFCVHSCPDPPLLGVRNTALAETVDLERLMTTHQADVWWYLRLLGCEPNEADDLAQETFVEVLGSHFVWQGDAAALGFLRTIARRRYARRREANNTAIDIADLDDADQTWESLNEGAARDEQLDALGHCLEALDERSRRALELQFHEGLERAAIAKALNVRELNIKAILQRAKAALRDCLTRRLDP